MVAHITTRLMEAARTGEGAVLDEVDELDPRLFRYLIAALAVKAFRTHA